MALNRSSNNLQVFVIRIMSVYLNGIYLVQLRDSGLALERGITLIESIQDFKS